MKLIAWDNTGLNNRLSTIANITETWIFGRRDESKCLQHTEVNMTFVYLGININVSQY